MAKKPKSFPGTLFVKREVDGANIYFLAVDDVQEAAEKGEVVKVGVYKFSHEVKVECVTRVTG